MYMTRLGAFAILLSFAAGGYAQTFISGGSNTMTSSQASQLATWLGEGDLEFDRVFAHVAGDGMTAADFHFAADGVGRTFTVIRALGNNGTFLIGGYNPRDWQSSGGYVITADPASRPAFLFNLSTNTRLAQSTGATGQYQSFNGFNFGPTFGGGHDLFVGNDLASGYANPYSYGGGAGSFNVMGTLGQASFSIDRIDVFTIASAPVPEPATLSVAAVAAIGLLRRRRYTR